MKTVVSQTLAGRWFVGCVHAALWLLLYFVATGFGGKPPGFRDADNGTPAAATLPPVNKLDRLFAPGAWPDTIVATNSLNAFYTRHFIPPSVPAPPPPSTRKIELVYQGFYQTDEGRQAVVKYADSFLVSPEGSLLTANLFSAEITASTLLLTNSSGATNLLQLNAKQEIEVPIQ